MIARVRGGFRPRDMPQCRERFAGAPGRVADETDDGQAIAVPRRRGRPPAALRANPRRFAIACWHMLRFTGIEPYRAAYLAIGIFNSSEQIFIEPKPSGFVRISTVTPNATKKGSGDWLRRSAAASVVKTDVDDFLWLAHSAADLASLRRALLLWDVRAIIAAIERLKAHGWGAALQRVVNRLRSMRAQGDSGDDDREIAIILPASILNGWISAINRVVV
jgi:hypothetical protein